MQKQQTPLHIVHANYLAEGGLKKIRFREALLWQADQPSYYSTERLLTFDLYSLEPPQDWLQQTQVDFHAQNIGIQLDQASCCIGPEPHSLFHSETLDCTFEPAGNPGVKGSNTP